MRRERGSRRFEKGREVREERTRSVREEASEEDRRQWEKVRDLGEEAGEDPNGASTRARGREGSGNGERARGAIGRREVEESRERRADDGLEAPPGD